MGLFKLSKMNKTQIVLLAVLLLVIESSIMTAVSCRPNEGASGSSSNHHRHHKNRAEDMPPAEEDSMEHSDLTVMELEGIRMCQADEDLMELCMRCVKATKARNVYPMCCLNEDGVGDWCRDFVYFGIQ